MRFRGDPFHDEDVLTDWLNQGTFAEEQRFADVGHARDVARVDVDDLLRNGTTTAVTFCAVYRVRSTRSRPAVDPHRGEGRRDRVIPPVLRRG